MFFFIIWQHLHGEMQTEHGYLLPYLLFSTYLHLLACKKKITRKSALYFWNVEKYYLMNLLIIGYSFCDHYRVNQISEHNRKYLINLTFYAY